MLNYEEKYKEAYSTNIGHTAEDAKQGKLDAVINNFCRLHGVKRDRVVREIVENEIVRILFAKNPNKQNFYEKLAYESIKKLDGISNCKNLPNRNLYVLRGGVLTKEVLKNSGGEAKAKTIDFQWNYGGKQFYASHKYTKESGGTQMGQYKDLHIFIAEARQNNKKNTYFIAIADGNFYQQKDVASGMSLIDCLKKEASNGKVFACNINELESLMKDLVGTDL